jgi:hypothetical protein
MFNRWILWKTDCCYRMFKIPKVSGLKMSFFSSFGPLADFSLFSYCFEF